MQAVLIGGGKVGAHLAELLSRSGWRVTLVEKDRKRCAQIREDLSGIAVACGDGNEPAVLDRTPIRNADAVVAVTGDDEDNLVVCLLAKREYGVARTIGRVNDPRNEWLFDARFGVDEVVSSTSTLATLLLEDVQAGEAIELLRLIQRDVALIEITMPEDSPAAGRTLAALALPAEATVVAVVRDARVAVAAGNTVLEPGDRVIAVTSLEAEDVLRRSLLGG